MISITRTLTAGIGKLRRMSRRVHGRVADASLSGGEVRLDPAFDRYAAAARAAGLEGIHLFLSFDCDTDRDAADALTLHGSLQALGIVMTLAVPGAQLMRNAEIYRGLARRGVEFMNHGGQAHAKWDVDRYVPMTFYDQMDPSAVEDDIRAGHDLVVGVTGRVPLGFRAPHFGGFQKPDQLALIYRVVRSLGYSYCSTTLPQTGLDRGPFYRDSGMIELPTFGSVRAPTVLLDSWTYLHGRKDYRLSNEYADLAIETVDVLARLRTPAILSWYADPSHVIGQEPFLHAMKEISRRGIQSLSGSACAALAERLIAN